MFIKRFFTAAALATLCLSFHANAATQKVEWSAFFGLLPMPTGGFVLDFDFKTQRTNSTIGLSDWYIENAIVEPGISYSYNPSQDILTIGGRGNAGSIFADTNDIALVFYNASKGLDDLRHGYFVRKGSAARPLSNGYATSTPVNPVPLPAGLPLFLAGLGAFGWVSLRRRS